LAHLPPNIPLTNAKGAFSSILAEFVALGYLYFDKRVINNLKYNFINIFTNLIKS